MQIIYEGTEMEYLGPFKTRVEFEETTSLCFVRVDSSEGSQIVGLPFDTAHAVAKAITERLPRLPL